MLLLIVGVLCPPGYVHGHSFTPNEGASFLSLMDDLKSINSLIRSNVDNVTVVPEFANNSLMLLNCSTMKEIND